MKRSATLQELADLVGGSVEGDPDIRVDAVRPLHSATESDLAFFDNEKLRSQLETSSARGIVTRPNVSLPAGRHAIRVEQPLVAWSKIVRWFHPDERRFHGISDHATVGPDSSIDPDAGIGPGVHIGRRVRIGSGTEIYPGTTIADDVEIGRDCRIYAGVHIYHGCRIGDRVILHSGVVVGADGYGYVQEQVPDAAEPVRHRKVPQVGSVVIEDDVEVGANSTIDRGALDPTVIGRGTKIDNLVMVAHNCRIGPHVLLIAQSGLSGSVEVGAYATIAGQAGVAGHLRIGARAVVAARTGVLNHVGDGEVVLGSPALPAGVGRRAYAQIEHLPEFRQRIRALEERLRELEARWGGEAPAKD
ncbi:MAG TPA: UDP-3-O-(3-hydroxymyristoyl)glucosamine N-acyltransferase [Planctomycetota bacterium]|nr:UDP-3-O-(3-hydroxymyristoyl)glucosamine N-acyltransferase [Planctomycetota bacterium]